MKRWEAGHFWKNWERELCRGQDSYVAVLFSSREIWDMLPRTFREKLLWRYQVLFFEMEVPSPAYEKKQTGTEQTVHQLMEWHPDIWIVVGDFTFQQWVRSLEEKGTRAIRACIRILTGSDFQVAGSRDVWLRDRQGRTYYEKEVAGREEDGWVILHRRDRLERKVSVWRRKLFGECGRDLCEELAEPLTILYGIPIEIGGYFALRYLFDVWERGAVRPGRWERAYQEIVRLGKECRKMEIESMVIPEKNLPLLIRMAADGIQKLPEGQQLSIETIEGFYRTLC